MFTARVHAEKTVKKLLSLLPESERQKPQVIFLQGERTVFRHDTDRELSFRQESNFYYLTGCDVPSSVFLAVVAPNVALETTLLIPKEDPLETMWSPPPPSIAEASTTFEATKIINTEALSSFLESLVQTYPTALFHVLPPSALFPARRFPESFKSPLTEEYLLSALHRARLIKTPAEIELMRRANEISSRAHEVVMRLLGQGILDLQKEQQVLTDGQPLLPAAWRIAKEAEAEAVFVASCRREGAVHQAYLPIVAASTRASTLHYCCNDREFAWGPESHDHSADIKHSHDHKTFTPQVLLIDAGCEWLNYASDITRVTPVGNGGKFTPEAKAIYSLVLKMQMEGIAALKPGLHWDLVQLQCHKTLVRGFVELGIFKGSEEEILGSGISAAFFPHGVGHSIGLDVHDVPPVSKPIKNTTIPTSSSTNPEFYTYLRLRLPLEAGMVVTVEPGIYFSPHLLKPVRDSPLIDHAVLKRYESVGGVRIEDVVHVTENGADVLSPVGKDVEWLEAVASGAASG